jgi:hypothetical protein
MSLPIPEKGLLVHDEVAVSRPVGGGSNSRLPEDYSPWRADGRDGVSFI